MNKEFLKQIEDLQKQIDILKEKVNSNVPLIEGKWYKIYYTNQHCYGLHHDESSFHILRYYGPYSKDLHAIKNRAVFYRPEGFEVMMSTEKNLHWLDGPATEDEIREALTSEAIKRGYEKGVNVESFTPSEDTCCYGKFTYFFDEDRLFAHETGKGGPCIYEKGKFAKIIKRPAITIGSYEVKFIDGHTSIDGNIFTKKFWESAKIISENSKAKIMIGCSKQFDVSLETINNILDRLK